MNGLLLVMDERRRVDIPGNNTAAAAQFQHLSFGPAHANREGSSLDGLAEKEKLFLLSPGEGEKPQALQNA
jgi:hypothetical protein